MFKRIWEWLIPDEIRRYPRLNRKARRINGFAIGFGSWIPIFAGFYAFLGCPRCALIALFSLIFPISIPLIQRQTRSPLLAGQLASFGAFFAYTILALLTGGVKAPVLQWFVTIPLLAIFLVDLRAGLIWTVVTTLTVSAFYGLDAAGVVLPQELSSDALPAMYYLGFLGLIWCVFIITIILDHLETNTLREAERASAEANAANRAQTEFLANMSHEIRTPLNGVLGVLGLIAETKLSKHQRKLVHMARASGENLLTIINDILDFSKITSGSFKIEPVSFDLLRTVEDIGSSFALRAEEKGLDLILRYVPGTPRHLIGDEGRIRQVLVNLVGNALKFTEKGHVLLSAEAVKTDRAADEVPVKFVVEDSGIGIRADALSRLFERFMQVDASTTRKYGGTGLGLAISKHLVEMQGGEITVSSTAGKGSTFCFTLPLPVDHTLLEELTAPPEIKGLHVLVVDDNTFHCEVLCEMTASWGLRTTCAASSSDALVYLRQAQSTGDPFGLVLMQHRLTSKSGMQLRRELQHDDALKQTRTILLTTVGEQNQQEEVNSSDSYVWLLKPVQPSRLLETIVDVWTTRISVDSQGTASPGGRKSWPPKPPPKRFHARVLVTEDHAINQQVAQLALERLGCQVDIAANGREALKILGLILDVQLCDGTHNSVTLQNEEAPQGHAKASYTAAAGNEEKLKCQRAGYDLIFMDCEMPEMDGFETTSHIRKYYSPEQLPVVAMTARAFQSDRKHCEEVGMNDYLTKPVEIDTFAAMLEKWTNTAIPPETEAKPDDDCSTPLNMLSAYSEVAVWEREIGSGLDLTALRRLQDMVPDQETLLRLMETFVQQTENSLVAMEKFVSANDAEQLQREAHKLKGGAANLGAAAIQDTARQLEKLARTNTLGPVPKLIADLHRELRKIKTQLFALGSNR